MPCQGAGGRPGASLPVRRFARRLCCEAGLPVGSGRGLCVGRGGSCAAVACLAGAGVACVGRGLCAAGRAGVAAGFSRGQGPGLGSALLAVVRFRGAARGPLRSAVRGALSCMGRAAGVRPAGGKQQSYKYSKKSMSRKHQSQHPLTTTRNFTSFFPEKATGVAGKE